jgi:hypothetical protein
MSDLQGIHYSYNGIQEYEESEKELREQVPFLTVLAARAYPESHHLESSPKKPAWSVGQKRKVCRRWACRRKSLALRARQVELIRMVQCPKTGLRS